MANLFDLIDMTKPPEIVQSKNILEDYGTQIFTYFMVNRQRKIVKIGKSYDVLMRHEALEKVFGMDFELMCVVVGDRETEYHERFKDYRIGREFFELSEDVVDFMKRW